MNNLIRRQFYNFNVDSILHVVLFSKVEKEHMTAINNYLGVQVFQEKYIDSIIDGYNDGDQLIPIFHKDGSVENINLGDWLYVKNGEVYSAGNDDHLMDLVVRLLRESEDNNNKQIEIYET